MCWKELLRKCPSYQKRGGINTFLSLTPNSTSILDVVNYKQSKGHHFQAASLLGIFIPPCPKVVSPGQSNRCNFSIADHFTWSPLSNILAVLVSTKTDWREFCSEMILFHTHMPLSLISPLFIKPNGVFASHQHIQFTDPLPTPNTPITFFQSWYFQLVFQSDNNLKCLHPRLHL